jgi:hypothetical protein
MLHTEYILVGELGLRIYAAIIRTTRRPDKGEKLLVTLTVRPNYFVWRVVTLHLSGS